MGIGDSTLSGDLGYKISYGAAEHTCADLGFGDNHAVFLAALAYVPISSASSIT